MKHNTDIRNIDYTEVINVCKGLPFLPKETIQISFESKIRHQCPGLKLKPQPVIQLAKISNKLEFVPIILGKYRYSFFFSWFSTFALIFCIRWVVNSNPSQLFRYCISLNVIKCHSAIRSQVIGHRSYVIVHRSSIYEALCSKKRCYSMQNHLNCSCLHVRSSNLK